MCTKILATIFTIIALAMAIIVSVWHTKALDYIIFVSRFFDVMLPILAVGALLKYIFGGSCHCHHRHSETCCQKKD